MSNLMNIETARNIIMEKLQQLQDDDKKPTIKLKDIYRNNKQWSPVFFKAGKDLDVMNENVDMFFKSGFHCIKLTE